MNIKRMLCIILTLLMLVSVVACNKGDDSENNNNNDDQSSQETTKTFNNADYTVLSRLTTAYEFDNSGEGTDDKVQRKIWERNVFIKDTYDVNVNVITEPGSYDERDSFIAKVRSSLSSGADEFSMISTHSSYMQSIAIEGLGKEISSIPQINISNKWWCEPYAKNSEINGKSYVLVGDIALKLYENIEVVFFNTTLAEEYQLGDLYQIVLDGNWTLDKMIELSKVAGGYNNQTSEQYGLLANSHSIRYLATSLGLRYTTRDNSTGRQSFRTSVPAKMETTYAKILEWHQSDVVRYGEPVSDDAENSNPLFSNGKSLFYMQMLGEAKYMASAMSNYGYGVLPFPKLEEGKSAYKTACCDEFSAQLIPLTVVDTEMVGTVTEALCKYSNENVIPEYYETRLKFRYFDDYQVQSMLDLIREGLTFDFAQIYGSVIAEWPYATFSYIMEKNITAPGSESITYFWRSNAPIWNRSLSDLYSKVDKLEESN